MSDSTSVGERITLNLTQNGSQALAGLMALGRSSKTDTIGRALTVYALILRAQAEGGGLYVREGADGPIERNRIV